MMVENEDWKLKGTIGWESKKKPTSEPCKCCGGSGTVGGGFKSIDDPSSCPECFGSGSITVYPALSPEPELPPGLVEHMRAAYLDFFKGKS